MEDKSHPTFMEERMLDSASEDQCNWNVLSEAVEKIKIGLSLHSLLAKNVELLKQYLSPADHEYLQNGWRNYFEMEKIKTHRDRNDALIRTEKISGTCSTYLLKSTEEISKLCYKTFSILQTHGMKAYIEENLQEMTSEPGREFLRIFQKLRGLPTQKTESGSKFKSNRRQDDQEQLDLARKAEEELAEVHVKYEDQKTQCEQALEEKRKLIADYRVKLEAIRQSVSRNIGKIIEVSEEKIAFGIRSSRQRQENMLKTLAATEEKLKGLQEFNKEREEALHAIRKNSETELKSLIDKYDEDMNRKQCELENLMAQFEKEKVMYIELKKNFESQNETYVKLMAEKRDYEQMLWDQRLLEVRQKFAARKIQRCVRNYLAKLKTRGKKYGNRKKGKKGAKK